MQPQQSSSFKNKYKYNMERNQYRNIPQTSSSNRKHRLSLNNNNNKTNISVSNEGALKDYLQQKTKWQNFRQKIKDMSMEQLMNSHRQRKNNQKLIHHQNQIETVKFQEKLFQNRITMNLKANEVTQKIYKSKSYHPNYYNYNPIKTRPPMPLELSFNELGNLQSRTFLYRKTQIIANKFYSFQFTLINEKLHIIVYVMGEKKNKLSLVINQHQTKQIMKQYKNKIGQLISLIRIGTNSLSLKPSLTKLFEPKQHNNYKQIDKQRINLKTANQRRRSIKSKIKINQQCQLFIPPMENLQTQKANHQKQQKQLTQLIDQISVEFFRNQSKIQNKPNSTIQQQVQQQFLKQNLIKSVLKQQIIIGQPHQSDQMLKYQLSQSIPNNVQQQIINQM